MARTWRILLLLTLGLAPAPAAHSATEFVGIPDQDFTTHYRSQRGAEWCWASCIEMALSAHGIAVPQDTLVARGSATAAAKGALPRDLLRGANGLYPTVDGGQALVTSRFVRGSPPAALLYAHLQDRRPAILLYRRDDGRGHAVLLSGMDVARDPARGLAIEALHVFDPSAGAEQTGPPAGDPLACRLIYPTRSTVSGTAIADGVIDGVVLVDSVHADLRRNLPRP